MQTLPPTVIDVAAWAASAPDDPVKSGFRRATHIALAAIADMRPHHTLYLKGGVLLGLVYNSRRMTNDIDFTAGFPPTSDIDEQIKTKLNQLLPAFAARLGYTQTQIRVRRVTKRPEKYADQFEENDFPSLEINIAHGAPNDPLLKIEISFNEPDVTSVAILDIGDLELHAYSLTDVIAEKIRALLQQPIRNREREQDVYDIHFLLGKFDFDDRERAAILRSLLDKCSLPSPRLPRHPDIDSIDNPEIKRKAQACWNALGLETGILPDFETCFEVVRQFYRNLPWATKTSS